MMLARVAGVALLALLLATTAPAATSVTSFEPAPLSGVARDIVGNVVEDVEVLVLRASRGGDPLAVTRTDARGRFTVAGLAPGVYRIAAIKSGYRTWLGRVNTLLDASLELLLRPVAGPDDNPEPPRDSAWLLRLPRRSVLRDIEETAIADAELVATASPPPAYELEYLQVEQSFLIGESVPGGDALGLEGSETAMDLAGVVGERARIRFQGNRERLTSGDAPLERPPAEQEASSLLLSVSYDYGRSANLDINAFYSRNDLDFGPAAGSLFDPLRQGHRAWGYDAAWSLQLDPASRVSIQLDYRDAAMALAGEPALAEPPDTGELIPFVTNRRIGAQGIYEAVPARRHQVRVGFRAQFVERPPLRLRAVAPGPFFGDPGIGGWSLRLDTENSWSAAAPVTLVYGLGYKHALAGGDSSLLVPRIGGVFRQDQASLRLVVSYHAARAAEEIAYGARLEPAEAYRPHDPLGYDARLELPVAEALRLSGELAYAPIQFEEYGFADGAEDSRPPLYVSDGNAASRRASLALTHESERAATTFRVTEGSVEGTLAPLPLFAGPVQLLSDGRLRYRNGTLGVRVIPSGTHLSIEYRRLEESAVLDGLADATLSEESVELRLMQDLLRALRGSWRLLMAVRLASLDGEEDTEAGSAGAIRFASTGHQLSAGVSVTF